MFIFNVNGSDVFMMDDSEGIDIGDIRTKVMDIAKQEDVEYWEVDMRFSSYVEVKCSCKEG